MAFPLLSLFGPSPLFAFTMKRFLSIAFASLALTSSSFALQWNSTFSGSPLDYLYTGDLNYSNEFNLLTNGYDPATMVITSATAKFWFADDTNNNDHINETTYPEWVKISLNTTGTNWVTIGTIEVDGLHPESNYAEYQFSFAAQASAAALLSALQDGKMNFKVELVSPTGGAPTSYHDTYLKVAQLTADGSLKTTSVPDTGATAALLSLGLLAMVAGRKRFGRRV